MELETCAVIGRLNLPARRDNQAAPSTYNISRLGLTATADAQASSPAPAPLPPAQWPVVVAEPVAAPGRAAAPASRSPDSSERFRRKTSFALPAQLLDQVRARATATGAYQYAIVAQALQWFFQQQVDALSQTPRRASLGSCVWRALGYIIHRRPAPR